MDSVVAASVRESGFAVVKGMFVPFVPALRSLQGELPSPSYLGGVLAGDAVLLNETLSAELESLLGSNFLIARSYLGNAAADFLATTRNRSVLFGDDVTDSIVPPFSVTLFVPLVDTVARCRGTNVPLISGDCLLVDSRMPSEAVSDTPIPGLLVVFSRAWFREKNSIPGVAPVELSLFEFFRLPLNIRVRLQWRFDRYFSQRPRLFLYQMANRLPFIFGAPLKRKLRRWASSY